MQHSSAGRDAKLGSSFLIIEDSLFDQKRIQRILKRSFKDAQLHYASTLHTAQKILERTRITMILLDNNLPDGRGANYAQTLAKDPQFGSIPVIMISDWPTPFMWDKAESAGVKFVLKKDEFHAGHVQHVLANNGHTPTAYV